MRNTIVHPHSDVTHFDLYKYSESVSKDITAQLISGSKIGFASKHLNTIHWANLKEFIDYLEYDVLAFGHATIYRKRLDIAGLKYTLDKILTKYPAEIKGTLIPMVEEVYKGFYDAFKKTLENIEYYELIPELNRKYKRIKKVLTEIKNKKK